MRGLLVKGPALSFRPFLAAQRSGISKLSAKWGRSDVRLWPISEVAARLIEVRSLVHSGLDLLKVSSSHFDPTRTFDCSGQKALGSVISHALDRIQLASA